MSVPRPAVSPEAFRRLVGRWATGVSVVTGRDAEGDVGLTVNALLSVALSPPLLLVSLSRDADSTPVVDRTGAFGVSVLTAEQRSLSERFAQPASAAEKFDGVAGHRGPGGLFLLDDSLAAFECRVTERYPVADHILFIGEVVHAEPGSDAAPLVFYRSRYAEAAGTDRLTLPAPGAGPRHPY